jgi:hypothetical protein
MGFTRALFLPATVRGTAPVGAEVGDGWGESIKKGLA